ncbi:MAG: winged helix-turn-helix domain-containing protein [Candidatus Acidiferrales bacterium]
MNKLKNIDLKDALANAEAELAAVLKRAESLREWIAVTKKLCAKNSKASAGMEVEPIIRRRTRNTTLAQQIREVLLEAGKPMHVDDIVKSLQTKGHPVMAKNPKATIAVALSRRTEEFERVMPNTFALVTKTNAAEVGNMAS